MKNALIYTRVSTEEQSREGVSLDIQTEKCELQAQLLDYNISVRYQDKGKSAKNLKREGIQEVIKLVERKKIDAVIIYKLDRLTRNVSDLNRLIEMMVKKGVELISVKDSLNTSTASGRMIINLLGTISQWERETISERTSEAMQFMKSKGKVFTSNAPFGKTDLNGTYIENPEEQLVIDKICQYKMEGKSIRTIVETLRIEGVKTRKGTNWYFSGIRNILNTHKELLAPKLVA